MARQQTFLCVLVLLRACVKQKVLFFWKADAPTYVPTNEKKVVASWKVSAAFVHKGNWEADVVGARDFKELFRSVLSTSYVPTT